MQRGIGMEKRDFFPAAGFRAHFSGRHWAGDCMAVPLYHRKIRPLLANVLHWSIDQLMGYAAEQKRITDYEERYKADGYYWGVQPFLL